MGAELEAELGEKETSLGTLKTTLAQETDRRGSLAESVGEYERKLKDLEGRMWDNLNKEAQRRSDAEAKAKRLKKKVLLLLIIIILILINEWLL